MNVRKNNTNVDEASNVELTTAQRFRDVVLGRFSSHPDWREKRARLFRLFALLPLGLLLVLFLVALTDLLNWRQLFIQLPNWIFLFACGLAFYLGLTITLSILNQWSAMQAKLSIARKTEHPNLWGNQGFPFDWSVFTLALVVAVLGPWFIRRFVTLPNYLHLLPEFLAFLPILVLLLGLKYLRKERPFRIAWLFVLSTVLVLALITIVYDIADMMQHEKVTNVLDRYLPFYASLGDRFLGAAILLPMAYFLYWGWRFWGGVKVDENKTETLPEKEDAEGEGRNGDEHGQPPDWILSVISDLKEEYIDERIEVRLKFKRSESIGRSVSNVQLIKEPALIKLALPHSVTRGQAEFLNSFREDYISWLHSDNRLGDVGPIEDLVLEGSTGSGRTTVLIVAALYTVFVRGQNVLFLLPSELRCKSLKKEIDDKLRQLDLQGDLIAEICLEKSVFDWIEGRKDLPQIILATVDSSERCLYGAAINAEDPLFQRLKKLLIHCAVVLVEDLIDFDAAQRLHLPMQLAKHDLILASEGISSHRVLVAPALADEVAGRALSQILTKRKRKVISLEPIDTTCDAWTLDLKVDTDTRSEIVNKVVKQISAPGKRVLLSMPGLSTSEARKLRKNFSTSKYREKTDVIVNPDEMDSPDFSPVQIIVSSHQPGEGVERKLILRHCCIQDTVLLVRLIDHSQEVGEKKVIPVFAGTSSVHLLGVHLRSVARFLEMGSPIPLENWLSFGLDIGNADSENVTTGEEVQVALGLDHFEENLRDHLGEVAFDFAFLKLRRDSQYRVDVYEPVVGSSVLQLNPDTGHIRLVTKKSSIDSQMRQAEWRFSGYNQAVDLACVEALSLEREGEVSVLGQPRQEAGAAIQLFPVGAKGFGMDHTLPVIDIQWKIVQNISARPEGIGAPHYGYLLYTLADSETEDETEISVTVKMFGLMDDFGVSSALSPINYSYQANLGFVLLRPNINPNQDNIQNCIVRLLAGHWETDASGKELPGGQVARPGIFWPALTAAFNYALRRYLPGLGSLSKIMVFGLEGQSKQLADAVLWLVGPRPVGLSFLAVFAEVLGDDRQRRIIFESMKWVLDSLASIDQTTGTRRHLLRRFSRIGFDGDEDIHDLEAAQLFVERMLELTDSLAQQRMSQDERPEIDCFTV